MDKSFDSQSLEKKWYSFWEESGFFKANVNRDKNLGVFTLMMPPPNVTGSLHMGHAFQDTLMDILTRFNRMKGHKTLLQPGTDHAGIATQILVENKLLHEQNSSRYDLGREEFIKKIWEWKQTSGNHISQQLRRMGVSADWSREKFTMDDELSSAVNKAFVRLYDDGLIYRNKRLVNWDPKLLTAISDIEVENIEEEGYLYHVSYPLIDDNNQVTNKFLEIATTRPETILADGALAVNPTDVRYAEFIGRFVKIPVNDRIIPVIADDYVDKDFGTGCVKITPAHDFNDYAVGQRHNLEVINLFTPQACLNENAPKEYIGLDRFAARDKIVADLDKKGFLVKKVKHIYKRPYGDRSKAVIEPYLTDQWFVNAKTLAKKAIEVVKTNEIEFIPKNWENTYFAWLNEIQDWCISRQIWWGHRVPAWYDENGNIYVGLDEIAVREKYNLDLKVALTQDEDVLDTWFSSGLWPFSTLGWPFDKANNDEAKELFNTFYPTSVLVTGFDIIFFWVARMIMFGCYFTNQVPFKKVYIHGLIRDSQGNKMSKSKGNVLDPIDIIDGITLDELLQKRTSNLMQISEARLNNIKTTTKQEFPDGIKPYGNDALRFTFCALASNGRDIIFDMQRCEGYRNFCNKIWNASRFILQRLATSDIDFSLTASNENLEHLEHKDKWIILRFNTAVIEIEKNIENYRFDLIAKSIYEFVWSDFCDWYIELTKIQPKDNNYHTLIKILDGILRLAHPVIPFITEEIYSQIKEFLPKKSQFQSLMLAPYPSSENNETASILEQEFKLISEIINNIRQFKTIRNIPTKKELIVNFNNSDAAQQKLILLYENEIKKLAGIKNCNFNETNFTQNFVILVQKIEISINLDGLIDKEKEITRFEQKIHSLTEEISKIKSQLENKNFLERAKPEIVAKSRDLLATKLINIDKLQKDYENIKNT